MQGQAMVRAITSQSAVLAPCLAPLPAKRARRRRAPPCRVLRDETSDEELATSTIKLSGEWEAVASLASQDDMLLWYNHDNEARKTHLGEIMQTNLVLTHPDASLSEVVQQLDGPPSIEGMPVVDAHKKLVGVISRKDLRKPGSSVKDVMSAKPIALHATDTVADAVIKMVEHKIHRVPVVDNDFKTVGIVTRTDIFFALTKNDSDGETLLGQHGLDL